MAYYMDGNPVSGLNSIPRLTLAQYNALNVKPEFWVRTDAPESYKKLSADQVSYDSNNTVKDKIEITKASSNLVALNGTYQIPSTLWNNHKIFLISVRRSNLGGDIIFNKDNAESYQNHTVVVATGEYYLFSVSSSGLITLNGKPSDRDGGAFDVYGIL